MKRLAAVCLALALVACAAVSTERNLQIACENYAESISVLSIQNALGNLSKKTQDNVDLIVLTVGPICSGENADLSPSAALTRVEAALVTLLAARRDAGNGG